MAAVAVNGAKLGTASQAYLESRAMSDTKVLISDLCRQFYNLGWVSGTGGSITIKVHDDSVPKPQQLVVMSPSGVQKERMLPEDMYVLSPNGSILSTPSPKPYPHKPPKCSDCGPLFMKNIAKRRLISRRKMSRNLNYKAYEMRNAGAVIHSHGIESCLVTMINPLAKEFRITHMEMIKGIQGHGYYDELVVPIIENTAHEYELTESLAKAIEAYPKTTAVLVRNHGIYIWGDSWISAKTQAECYHYLFDAAIKLNQLGLDPSTPIHGPIQNVKGVLGSGIHRNISVNAGTAASDNKSDPAQRCIVLDIEGTTTPISFVTDVLFPYARNNVGRHLSATYDTAETQDDIKLLRSQVQDDLEKGVVGSVPIPLDDVGKEGVIAALVANVESMIKADRKITALKQLQGHIWRTGYEKKELEGVVFEDVPEALKKWHDSGIKVYIYSSGSRLAQRLVFGNSNYGDLREYLSGFFDTTVGNKRESSSYAEIVQSVGVDKPSQVLFVTDVFQEAVAAKEAGNELPVLPHPSRENIKCNQVYKPSYQQPGHVTST
ncbi:probable bifunctional methylthioribulose-1-phosphate dehydratase/enolase-phosphatase E1 1 isoform X1 [Prunus dulcis]|uniref:probable bifunctional methylthioribulose-1-phosphate dehydratase/enolase-phosphatase E1 1 isoform X1 n=1 Tax=Prunus dulcis TaxID=3755 RepID=UPI0014822675|nr:probable bifunctional methylthioribulose-1-phosphate dehydratase/enolase-phosphatase E1 1 isoform X1 [Prunus dulcis]